MEHLNHEFWFRTRRRETGLTREVTEETTQKGTNVERLAWLLHEGESWGGDHWSINQGHMMAEGYCLAQSCGLAHAGIHQLIDTPWWPVIFPMATGPGVQDEQGFLSHFLGSRFSCTSVSSQDTIHPGTCLISDHFKLLLSPDGTNSKTFLLFSSSHSASFHWNKTSRGSAWPEESLFLVYRMDRRRKRREHRSRSASHSIWCIPGMQ